MCAGPWEADSSRSVSSPETSECAATSWYRLRTEAGDDVTNDTTKNHRRKQGHRWGARQTAETDQRLLRREEEKKQRQMSSGADRHAGEEARACGGHMRARATLVALVDRRSPSRLGGHQAACPS